MENISTEIVEKAYQVCYYYLGGIWQNISQKEIIIEKLSGGYANLTLKLSLPSNYRPLKEEPIQVIMKVHLDVLEEGYFRQMTENIIAVSLAEKNLAPKVYGVFDGGRLDEYFISRPLVKQDLRNHNIISEIARKLAHLHSLTLPIDKNPNRMYNQLEEFVQKAITDPRNKEDDPKRKVVIDKFISLDPNEELKWLREIIDAIESPVVYCHGDLQINNILLQKNSLDVPVLHIIDFDISGYNYRGVDFAGINSSFCFELPYPEPPYIKFNWDESPNLEEQKFIISIYLEEFQKQNNVKLDFEKEMDKILKETKVFILMTYYFFISFLIGKKETTITNQLDWIMAADIFLNRYKDLKQEMISAN